MDIGTVADWHNLVTAALIGAAGFVVSWARKVNTVLNETVQASAMLAQRLNGHIEAADERHDELTKRVDELSRRRRY